MSSGRHSPSSVFWVFHGPLFCWDVPGKPHQGGVLDAEAALTGSSPCGGHPPYSEPLLDDKY